MGSVSLRRQIYIDTIDSSDREKNTPGKVWSDAANTDAIEQSANPCNCTATPLILFSGISIMESEAIL